MIAARLIRFVTVFGATASTMGCGGASEPPPRIASPPASRAPLEASAAASPPAPGADIAAKIDPIFASLVDSVKHSPGCAVGVFRAGAVVFAKGYGYASLEHDIPLSPRTTFEIGSMSKQFTATAILLLVQDGKLSLADDVRKFIPELPNYGRPITLRHLLHHTGGLREYDALLDLSGWDPFDVATEEEALHLVALQKGTNFPAGSEWSYSNTGYFLLAQVVKRATGKTLAVFSRERIFAPLGMNDTSIFDDHTQVVPRHATGYSPREGGGFKVNVSGREMTGEGNIQSTIEDIGRWDANFYEPKIGGRTWLASMRTPGTLDDGATPVPYAMGLVPKTFSGLPGEEHSGGWAGYVSDGRRYPSQRLSVTCLCNRDDVNPIGLTKAVVAALLPESAAPASTAGATSAAPPPAAGRAPGADVATFAGAYLEPNGLVVRTFMVQDGALHIGFGLGDHERPPLVLERRGERSFAAPGATSTWTFEAAAGKSRPRVTRTAPGEKTKTFERFDPQTLKPSDAAAFVGRYASSEMTHDFGVALVDGKLVAGPWGKPHMASPLRVLDRDTFDGDGFGLVFERGANGRVTGFVTVFDDHRATRWSKR